MVSTSPSYFGNYSDRDQPTLNTVANYVAQARILLQDKVPDYRYEDDSLIAALNLVLLEARRKRGDLFVYNWKVKGQTQAFTANDDTYVDIEPQFRMAILYGMCGHAMARDQEDIQDTRATTFFMVFNAILVGQNILGVSGGSGPNPQGGVQQ